MYRYHTTTTIDKALEVFQLLIGEIGQVEKLNHKVRALELLLGWEEIRLFDRHTGDSLEHGNKQLLDPNVVMLPSSMIFGPIEP